MAVDTTREDTDGPFVNEDVDPSMPGSHLAPKESADLARLPTLEPTENLTRAVVLRDVRMIHRAWFEYLAVAAGGKVASFNGAHTTYNPMGLGSANIAFPHLQRDEVGQTLDELIDWCGAQGRWSIIGCWTGGRPTRALGAALLARGFDWAWEPHWMALRLEDLPPQSEMPHGLEIVVDPPASLWDANPHPYYGQSSPELSRAKAQLLTMAHSTAGSTRHSVRRVRHTVALKKGKPVGAAVTYRVGNVIGLFDVGVLPSERNRGIGTIVTSFALHTAHKDGASRSILNATPLGEFVYRKLGFQSLGRGQTYWLHQDVFAKGAPHPDTVRFVEALGDQDVETLEKLLPGLQSRFADGIDVTLPCGLRPVEIAGKLRATLSARWLAEKGAVLDVLTACDLGLRGRVPSLLKAKPEIADHRIGSERATALHYAAAWGDTQLVSWLLEAGADATIADETYRSTPAGWARHFGHHALADRIESHLAGS